MTDASNFKDIATICPPGDATAACFFGNSFWVGDKTGTIWVTNKTDGSTEQLFRTNLKIPTPIKNYMVRALLPVGEPQCLIALYTGLGGQPGPVNVIRPGGFKNRLPQLATIAALSFSTLNPKLMLVFENTITVYKFCGEVLIKDFTLTAEAKVTAANICNHFLVYYCNQTYFQYDLETKETTKIPQGTVVIPTVHTVSADSILLTFKESTYIVNHKKKGQMIPYHSEFGAPNSFYGTRKSLYSFYTNQFTRLDIDGSAQPQIFQFPKVKTPVMLGNELLVMSPDTWRVYSSVRSTAQLYDEFSKGNKDSVFKTLDSLPEDQCSATMIQLFSKFWPNQPEVALSLTSKYLWLGDPRQLIMLFPQLVIDSVPKARKLVPQGNLITITREEFHIPIFTALQSTLEFMLDEYSKKDQDSSEVICLATALLQVYAICIETRKFADFMTTNTKINFEAFLNFINPLLKEKFPIAPCMAVYLTHKGNPEQAMQYWRALYKASPQDIFLQEAAFTIKQIVDNQLFTQSVDWLLSLKPIFVQEAFLSVHHDQNVVLSYLDANEMRIPAARMLYYDFLVQQPDILPESIIIQRCFETYVSILDSVGKNSLVENSVTFTDSFRKGLKGDELKAAIKEEITTKSMHLLQQHIELIGQENAMKIIENKSIDSRIRRCIYRFTENYEAGIKDIIQSNKEIPYDEIQDFCRNCPNPPQAFDCAFSLLPPELYTTQTEFIMKNVQFIDPVNTIKKIPQNTEVRPIADVIRVLFNLLVQRNEAYDKQIAVINSLQVDADYSLNYERAKFAALDENTTCPTCKKTINPQSAFLILPDGTPCHVSCKPKEFQ